MKGIQPKYIFLFTSKSTFQGVWINYNIVQTVCYINIMFTLLRRFNLKSFAKLYPLSPCSFCFWSVDQVTDWCSTYFKCLWWRFVFQNNVDGRSKGKYSLTWHPVYGIKESLFSFYRSSNDFRREIVFCCISWETNLNKELNNALSMKIEACVWNLTFLFPFRISLMMANLFYIPHYIKKPCFRILFNFSSLLGLADS